jgi:nucleotide-binding universal stress UspA family protein
MDTKTNILLLTDFSEVSENAANYALQIAKMNQAKVQLLHVVNTPVDWVKLPLGNEKLYPETKAEIGMAKFKLAEMAKEFSSQGVEVKQSLVYNLGVEDIAGHVKKSGVDLIVMGSHGAKGRKAVNIGSNTHKVLRDVDIPTLVVKSKPKDHFIKHIVFASTFEEDQKPAFQKIAGFAAMVGAQLHLLYVNTPYNFNETSETDLKLQLFCKDCDSDCIKHTFNASNEIRGIKYFLQNNTMDVVSIATAGKPGFVQIFSPSLTESLITHLDIPVLSIHK